MRFLSIEVFAIIDLRSVSKSALGGEDDDDDGASPFTFCCLAVSRDGAGTPDALRRSLYFWVSAAMADERLMISGDSDMSF